MFCMLPTERHFCVQPSLPLVIFLFQYYCSGLLEHRALWVGSYTQKMGTCWWHCGETVHNNSWFIYHGLEMYVFMWNLTKNLYYGGNLCDWNGKWSCLMPCQEITSSKKGTFVHLKSQLYLLILKFACLHTWTTLFNVSFWSLPCSLKPAMKCHQQYWKHSVSY